MSRLMVLFFIMATPMSSLVYANQLWLLEDYAQISEVEIQQFDYGDYAREDNNDVTPVSEVEQTIMLGEKMVAFGEKIWKIVEAGKPSIDAEFAAVSVLPEHQLMEKVMYEMSEWQAPLWKRYRVTYKNLYQIDVAKFDFTVLFQWGGTLDGKGRYLTGIKVIPNLIEVAWGFSFDATSKLVTITNRGTSEYPVAAATIELSFNVKSPVKEIKHTLGVHFTGNGELTILQ